MSKHHCDVHDLDIVIFDEAETETFVDDNRQEVAIFIDEDGNKYLKRYIANKCDFNCPIIKNLL